MRHRRAVNNVIAVMHVNVVDFTDLLLCDVPTDKAARDVYAAVTLLPWCPEGGSVIPSRQPLPKHFAHILIENDLRVFAGLAWCGRCGVLAVAVTWGRQKSVNFAGTCLQGEARDLSAR